MSQGRRQPSRGRSLIMAVALVVTSLGWSAETSAVCQLAPPEDSIDCFSDSHGTCCIVHWVHGEEECVAAYCMDYQTCAWELFFKAGCS